MEEKYSKKWNDLYIIFENALKTKMELCLDIDDEAYIKVTLLDKYSSGCGRCHSRYESFYVSGKIRTSYLENTWHSYSASIDIYDMHTCLGENPENQLFEPLFKGHIENTKFCVFHRFLGKDFFSQYQA